MLYERCPALLSGAEIGQWPAAMTMSRLGNDMFALRHAQISKQWALVLLRLIIGFGFMAHGWAKLSRGPDGFARIVAWIGFPLPHFFAWLTTITEIVTGFAMFIGAFVTLASIPMLIILLVAMFSVHLQYGFSSINTIGFDPVTGPKFGQPGMETDLLYIGGLILLALGTGAGALSVDGWRHKRKHYRPPSP